ncbi:MAG: DUF4831 family protein [Prevotella sp.]
MKKTLFIGMLLASTTAFCQTQISDYTPGITPEGAVYFLPKTAVRVAVKVEKTTKTPGEFCKYAERYLKLNGVQRNVEVSHRIVGCNVTPYGVADKNKAYAVKFNAKTVACNIRLSDDGRLVAINTDPSAEPTFTSFQPAPKPNAVNPRDYMSEEILAAGSTAKMAELTAREIYDIRESKNALNRGEADFMPKDGEQLRIMLNNLNVQDRVLTSLFSGTVTRDTSEVVFTICPEGDVERQVLFRLSQQLGVVDADDLAGSPFYVDIKDLKAVPEVVVDEKGKKKEREDGIYVNVPGKLSLSILDGNVTIASMEFLAGQYGHTELLSGELFNKRYTTRLKLNPVTGGVEKLDAEMPK